MHTLLILILGLVVGVLVGLLGIGGGIIVVPALVHLFGMDQHLAQGTSLFILLPPLGLGAAVVYWKKGLINLPAGLLCALGIPCGRIFRRPDRHRFAFERTARVLWAFPDVLRAIALEAEQDARRARKSEWLNHARECWGFC